MEQTKANEIYKYKSRVIIRVLLTLFTITTIVFGSMSVYILAMVGPNEIFSKGSVQSTQSYQQMVAMEVNMLKVSLDARKPFETAGELDFDKTIDIMNPQEMDERKKNKNTTFTVEDIIKMNNNGIFNDIENIVTNIAQGTVGYSYGDGAVGYSYGDGAVQYYDEDGTPVTMEEAYAGLVDSVGRERVLVEQMSALALEFPVSGKSLMEYIQDNNDNATPLIVLHALNNTRGMMYEYDEFAGRLSPIETNLRYFIKDNENNQVITNYGWEEVAAAEKDAKASDLFLEAKRGASGVFIGEESTAGFTEAKQTLKQRPLVSESEEVIIGVANNYPADDEMSRLVYSYNNLKPNFKPFLVLAILSLIGFVICFILATLTTGQDEKKGTVRLNIFDRIPTEIGASIVVLLGLMSLGMNVGIFEMVTNGRRNSITNIVYMFGMLMIALLIATWGYLSLVRRIKAKDTWRNSVCRRILAIAKRAYRAGKMNVRFVIAFAAFVFVNVLLAMSTGVTGILGLMILLIVDTAILVRLLKEVAERQRIKDGLDTIAGGNLDYKLDANNLQQDNQEMANAVNKIADGLQGAVEKSMKNERMRSELITNVSHDIKTPLTSIINYVDLLKREDIQNPQIKGYIDILDAKSQRLKHLTEDLVEASKVSSGNVELHMDNLFVQELLQQAEGEFGEKLKLRKLELVSSLAAEPVIIKADGRQMWRIFENLLNNIAKYALEGTRVYVDLVKEGKKATLTFKNMSQEALNINADELTERFVRGDISRTTEGSGLGLSIAKSLTELQGGKFDIYLDGDLFKVTLEFDTM